MWEIVNSTTLASSVKEDPKDQIEIEVGDSKQPDFKPQVKLMRWDNEVNFSVRAEEHPEATVVLEEGTVKYKTPEFEVHQYELPPSEGMEDGGFEFEWILPKKPATNVLTATIQTKGLDFFYQPPLTPKDIADGCSRPENVEGSYAVYHSTKGRVNEASGKNYKVGKAFHIYRPKAVDAKGAEAWCDLDIDLEAERLTVTVPMDFIVTAVYPVIVDPTLGYTSIGASSATGGSPRATGPYTASEDGTITMISIYNASGTASGNIAGAQYSTSAGVPNAKLAESNSAAAVVTSWNDRTLSGSITNGTDYFVAMWLSSGVFTAIAYDVTGILTYARSGQTYNTWPDPYSNTGNQNRQHSAYFTYTAAGSSAVKTVNDLAKASVKTVDDLAIASVKTIDDLA